MGPPNNRAEILQALRSQISNGKIIVGAGAGIGLTAKFVEQGGGDLIIIYNSGRFRMAGRGSLAGLMPYGNANDVVLEMVLKLSFSYTQVVWLTDSFRLMKSFQSSKRHQSSRESAAQIRSVTCLIS
jgi:predicted TIM-barrel enzyme